ncbi:MAG: restriction endonuclease subunit S [Coprococcus sp.]
MVKSGSTTGKVGYVNTNERFNIWSPLAAMRTNERNYSRFLFHLLQSDMVQKQVKAKASHGSQPNLSMRALEQFDVIIPPFDIQKS